MSIDRERILETTDIGALIERDLGAPVRRSGRWLFWRCPFHEERTASFGVTPDNGKWHCFGCGKSGNAIDWTMRRMCVEFVEACRLLGEADLPEPSKQVQQPQARPGGGPPPAAWQDSALGLVYDCRALLQKAVGERAREYLHKRGFTDDTIWSWRLGFQPKEKRYERLEDWGIAPPEDKKRHAMWIPRGITIPCFAEDGEMLRYVKICRGRRDRWGKYVKLRVPSGCSGTGLYGADWLKQRKVLFLDEGEFNALTVWQEAGDLVDAASIGSASIRPETLRPWWGHLLMAHCVLTRLDPDRAGAYGTEQWRALSRRVHQVQVPEGDDPNAFLQGGGDVRAWIEFELAKL